jgi:hypothetical protein
MFGRCLLVLLVGCGSSTIQVRAGDGSKVDSHDDGWVLGKCAPTKHITVTSTDGRRVAGALVVVRQLEHTNCPSVGPATPLYTTAPVRTDSHGVATTCDPDTFFRDDPSSFCPHHRDPVTVVVIAGDQAARLTAPFAADLRAVLVPCAELRALDPAFPCPNAPAT